MLRLLLLIAFELLLFLPEKTCAEQPSQWLIKPIKHSELANDGDTLTLIHTFGDIRINTADTDNIQLTAMAQYHKDDTRLPEIKSKKVSSQNTNNHIISVSFKDVHIKTDASWPQRRIDIGILIPKNIKLNISANNGFIEARNIQSNAELETANNDINYVGSGELTATSVSGNITARIENTYDADNIDISTLTGNIRCILLNGASAQVVSQTHSYIATDFTTNIDRLPHSTLKKGFTKIGSGKSNIKLKSQNGFIRLQGLMAPETILEPEE